VGKSKARGMEREEATVVFWRNEDNACKVIFTTYNAEKQEIFILARKQIWKSDKMYGIEPRIAQELSIKESRELWEILVKQHYFKRIGFEQQKIHLNSK
jgi:hypothetical protein